MITNLRTLLNFNEGYNTINREERNLAAIFYHTLLLGDNLRIFLDQVGCKSKIVNKEAAIYFEYAFIRDLWSNITQGNEFKRNVILDLLKPDNRKELEDKSILEFNTHFGSVPKPSATEIQSPGNWSISYYNNTIKENIEFLRTCEFKWCFNAKPDIVIHTSHNAAVCIEAKFLSREGLYPNNEKEKKIFAKRGIPMVRQLSIQKKIMEMLDITTQFIFLVNHKSRSSKNDNNVLELTWKDAFTNLDTTNCTYFIREWLKRPEINKTKGKD